MYNEGVYGKFWWMNPMGKLHRVTKLFVDVGHAEAATQILIGMNIQPTETIFKQMYDLGWIRIAFVGDQGLYTLSFNTNLNKTPSNIQMKALKDLAIEVNASEIRNNSNPKQRIDLF